MKRAHWYGIFNRSPTVLAASAALAVFMVCVGAAQQPAPNPAAAATNAFAIDLYQQLLRDKDNTGKNLWFSPYSITSALAMTAEGARGSTLAQMAKTLRFGEASQVAQLLPIHEGMAALYRQLSTDQFVVANALWGDQQYRFDQKYVDTVHNYYEVSGIFPVDFQRNAEAARSRINAWVEEQTRQKITDLLPQDSVDSLTRLVLTNAVYFKGSWAYPFLEGATGTQPFRLNATQAVTVPLMRGGAASGYMENNQLQAIAIPFKGQTAAGDMSMIVILPKKVDGLAEVEKSLTGASLAAWIGALSRRPVDVFLPKFKMTNGIELANVLATMGMPDAFSSSRADFSGISPEAIQSQLHISRVGHKAYLAVDENGAEAAAATYVVGMIGDDSIPERPAVFRADHPFLVLIRHNPSGTILFLGRVMNPAS